MKTHISNVNLLFSLLFVVAISFSSCCWFEDPTDDDCIDESEICETCPCIEIYEPVCGCNDVTYGNSCEAEINGVQEYTEGECPGGN